MTAPKVLFLDVDGVLNVPATFLTVSLGDDDQAFRTPFVVNFSLVERLQGIILETGCDLVLSSTWRNNRGCVPFLEEQIGRAFIGVTGNATGPRGGQIQEWLNANQVSRYAILDDDSDMLDNQLPNFFQTDPHHGLTATIAYRVAYHLNSVAEGEPTP